MTTGLAATFSVLANTQNEAAVRLLLDALDSRNRQIRVGALQALLSRRNAGADRELLKRWHTFSKRWKKIVAESSGRLSHAIRDAILSTDERLHQNGCDAVYSLREYDLIPTLITAAEDKSSPRGERAAETLLKLVDALGEELAAPRDSSDRSAPHIIRARVVPALERSVERFDHHQRREIAESFLILTAHDNPVLNSILQHPHDKAYVTLVHLLSHSSRPSVMRVILDSLDHPRTTSAIYSILARRDDVDFVRHMLRRFVNEVPKAAKANLKRIDSLIWLRDDLKFLEVLSGEELRAVIHLTLASGMSRLRVFDVVRSILQQSEPEGRREAARALTEFYGTEANALVIQAMEDDDPEVRAIAVSQLRERGIRGAITTLFGLIDGPDEAVREAAREALSEFTFDRFVNTFGRLEDDLLQETAQIVKRVDPSALDALRSELTSPLRARRVRAIQMAVAMIAVPDTESEIIHLLHDDDQVIRAAAAEALAQSPSTASRAALRDAILDRSQIVCDSVERTLQFFAESEPFSFPELPTQIDTFSPAPETGDPVS
ncbi:MAG: HEAT repeat domain-containing protein [Planctomycetaceae bacterium]|nr:HEAT repeat domain-containing protein [Planctomycetales bacterium]MCB9924496.1 HEAT repeat domain-containing protein [Planctomycetaceae bacterium]